MEGRIPERGDLEELREAREELVRAMREREEKCRDGWGSDLHNDQVADARLLVEVEADLAELEDGELDCVFDVEVCRECGCTDLEACDGGCWWVDDELCSACAHTAGDADEHGGCRRCGELLDVEVLELGIAKPCRARWEDEDDVPDHQ